MRTADFVRLLALAAIWGGSFLFMRVCAPALGAIPTAFGRATVGAACLLAIVLLTGARLSFGGRFGATLALGAINSGAPFLLFSLAARTLPAGYSAILNALAPLAGIAIGATCFGERPTGRQVAGVVLGLAGVAILSRIGPATLDAAAVLGIVACLVAVACYGFTGYLTRRWITERGGLDSRLVALGSQLGGTIALLPFFGAQMAIAPPDWTGAGPQVWSSLVGLGFLCTAVAYILYFRLIADVGPSRALAVTFLIPPFGVLWGALLLGEALNAGHAAGGGLIALALWLALRTK